MNGLQNRHQLSQTLIIAISRKWLDIHTVFWLQDKVFGKIIKNDHGVERSTHQRQVLHQVLIVLLAVLSVQSVREIKICKLTKIDNTIINISIH